MQRPLAIGNTHTGNTYINNLVCLKIVSACHSRVHRCSKRVLKLGVGFNSDCFSRCDVVVAGGKSSERRWRPFRRSVPSHSAGNGLACTLHLGPFCSAIYKLLIVDTLFPIRLARASDEKSPHQRNRDENYYNDKLADCANSTLGFCYLPVVCAKGSDRFDPGRMTSATVRAG